MAPPLLELVLVAPMKKCSEMEMAAEFAAVGKVGLKVKVFVRKLSEKFW